jgi:hypothetical protein
LFFTTNPLAYLDTIPAIGKTNEKDQWAESHQRLIAVVPDEFLSDFCPEYPQQEMPKVNALHSFNVGNYRAMYNEPNDLILYKLGDWEALRHEYFHSRLKKWSRRCLEEIIIWQAMAHWQMDEFEEAYLREKKRQRLVPGLR